MAEDATLGSRCSMAKDATLGAIRTVQIELLRLPLIRVVHKGRRLANCSTVSSILHSNALPSSYDRDWKMPIL
jgi:hypothetical protein